jgi:hypothetical protein
MKPHQMHDHIMSLIEQYDIICHWVARPPKAHAFWELEEVWIPKIKSQISYVTALHEIGHLRGRHRASRWRMVRERDAWRWAKSHALIWTDTIERQIEESLACCG